MNCLKVCINMYYLDAIFPQIPCHQSRFKTLVGFVFEKPGGKWSSCWAPEETVSSASPEGSSGTDTVVCSAAVLKGSSDGQWKGILFDRAWLLELWEVIPCSFCFCLCFYFERCLDWTTKKCLTCIDFCYRNSACSNDHHKPFHLLEVETQAQLFHQKI